MPGAHFVENQRNPNENHCLLNALAHAMKLRRASSLATRGYFACIGNDVHPKLSITT